MPILGAYPWRAINEANNVIFCCLTLGRGTKNRKWDRGVKFLTRALYQVQIKISNLLNKKSTFTLST